MKFVLKKKNILKTKTNLHSVHQKISKEEEKEKKKKKKRIRRN